MTTKHAPRKLVARTPVTWTPVIWARVTRTLGSVIKAVLIALFAFAIIGPLANVLLWAFAERWYYPFKLPATWGLRYWEVVFRPTGVAMASLATSV